MVVLVLGVLVVVVVVGAGVVVVVVVVGVVVGTVHPAAVVTNVAADRSSYTPALTALLMSTNAWRASGLYGPIVP